MAIINETYFFGELNIAQKSYAAVKESLLECIDIYEPEYLIAALGDDFSALFNGSMSEQRFEDLQAELQKEVSPIAAYVFFHYQRGNAYMSTGVGDAIPKAENASRTTPIYRMTDAWNIMVKRTKQIHKFLKSTDDDGDLIYPEFDIAETDWWLLKKTNDFGLL